ncbi:hypothetical protein C8J56DRAFT_901644 [Mycena floridula]|nr:hypothetical protein C8J56DRAFT_901644 [Mycena floridula]
MDNRAPDPEEEDHEVVKEPLTKGAEYPHHPLDIPTPDEVEQQLGKNTGILAAAKSDFTAKLPSSTTGETTYTSDLSYQALRMNPELAFIVPWHYVTLEIFCEKKLWKKSIIKDFLFERKYFEEIEIVTGRSIARGSPDTNEATLARTSPDCYFHEKKGFFPTRNIFDILTTFPVNIGYSIPTPETPEMPTRVTRKRPARKFHLPLQVQSDSDNEDLTFTVPHIDNDEASPMPRSSISPWPTSSSAPATSSPGLFPGPFPSSKTNRWVSTNNVLHGHVENALIGNLPYVLPRKRSLRSPSTFQYTEGKSAGRFKELMGDVIMRAEKASHETGCWIHIVGQHPNSKQSHLSYISPCLRREAIEDTLANAHSGIVAHRTTAQELSAKLLSKEAELEVANNLAKHQAAEIARLTAGI